MGWHSISLPADTIQPGGAATQDLELLFLLSCLNCNYKVFPEMPTQRNVPFLVMNKLHRNRRSISCDGSCCKHELIVDYGGAL